MAGLFEVWGFCPFSRLLIVLLAVSVLARPPLNGVLPRASRAILFLWTEYLSPEIPGS